MNDLPTEGLFALLTDEQTMTSMGRPCRHFKFEHPEEIEGDRDVAILLAEIDKSLRSFEKTAREHTWLSIEGAFAEDNQPQSAAQAFELGKEAGGVDLLQFICDAVLLEGGQVHELPTRCATRSTCGQALDFWNQNGQEECLLLCRSSCLKDDESRKELNHRWHTKAPSSSLRCSFRHKPKDQVEPLLAGPRGVSLCTSCVDCCQQVMQKEREKQPVSPRS